MFSLTIRFPIRWKKLNLLSYGYTLAKTPIYSKFYASLMLFIPKHWYDHPGLGWVIRATITSQNFKYIILFQLIAWHFTWITLAITSVHKASICRCKKGATDEKHKQQQFNKFTSNSISLACLNYTCKRNSHHPTIGLRVCGFLDHAKIGLVSMQREKISLFHYWKMRAPNWIPNFVCAHYWHCSSVAYIAIVILCVMLVFLPL